MISSATALTVSLIASYKGRTNDYVAVGDILDRAEQLNELLSANLTPKQLESIAHDVHDAMFYVDTMD